MDDPRESKTVILSEPIPGVVQITLNRPDATNALSLELQQALSAHFTDLALNDDVRCVILTGGQTVFAAGGDIHSLINAQPSTIYKRHTDRLWAPIQYFPKPLIAAINGYAYGGGCELAMLADILIAGESAQFSQPEIKIGIMPGIGGTQRLVRAVGKSKAMYMALTGRPISAQDAFIAGLVCEVCTDEETLTRALKIAQEIARMPPMAVEQIKETIILGLDAPIETALALERRANAMLFGTADQKEGMQAFLDKRHPKFSGK